MYNHISVLDILCSDLKALQLSARSNAILKRTFPLRLGLHTSLGVRDSASLSVRVHSCCMCCLCMRLNQGSRTVTACVM